VGLPSLLNPTSVLVAAYLFATLLPSAATFAQGKDLRFDRLGKDTAGNGRLMKYAFVYSAGHGASEVHDWRA
jgi:hypothetical protein